MDSGTSKCNHRMVENFTKMPKPFVLYLKRLMNAFMVIEKLQATESRTHSENKNVYCVQAALIRFHSYSILWARQKRRKKAAYELVICFLLTIKYPFPFVSPSTGGFEYVRVYRFFCLCAFHFQNYNISI